MSAVCLAGPSGPGSTAGGSIASQGNESAGTEARRILLRLEEKRQETSLGGIRAASADQNAQRGRLGVFLTTEFEWVDKNVSPNEPAFETSSKGLIAGADYAILPWLTAGAAVHYSYLDGSFDGDRGSFNTQSFGFTLYASASPMPNLFIDGTIGYIHREYDISRRANFFLPNGVAAADGFADGSTSGDEFNVAVLSGYDFHVGAFTVGPRFGVNYSTNSIDGYAENPRGTQPPTGLELVYDDQHRESLTTRLGFYSSYAFGTGFGVLVPQLSAYWVHEFLNDQRVIYFRFREDNLQARLRFQTDKPDRDYFHVGAGLVLVLPKDVSAFVSYRVLLGYDDRIAHTLDAGVRVQF
ncbi:MAG TPA: autotransporter outer membrane beta-barrel domain-containing protein [Methylomirabilota bacterium]|nr:autotransporter outer membrane beta-barrel domain-containing protein [Methylomirabilota bacterium]